MNKPESNAVLTVPEPGEIVLKKRPHPQIKPGSVLVKTEIAAVCVDDRMYTNHVHEWFDHPLYGCGHEGVGTVIEAPESRVFKPGDREKNLKIMGTIDSRRIDRPGIIRMLRNQEVQRMWDRVVTHEFPLSQAEQAFKISASQQCGKILLYPHRH